MINELTLKRNQNIIFNDPAPNKMIIAGRGFGKTGLAGAIGIDQLTIPNSEVAYSAPTSSQAKTIIWKTIKSLIPREWVRKISETVPLTIELKNNSTFTVFSGEAHDRARGGGADLYIADEIQDHSPEAFRESFLPMVTRKDGKIFLIGTPKGKSNWTYELLSDPEFKVFQFTTLDGGWVKPSAVEKAKRMLPAKTFRQEFEASFETAGLVVYDAYNEKNITDITFSADRETYLCFDFNVSPMSCIVLQRLTENNYVAVKEFILHNSNTDDTCRAVYSYLEKNELKGKLNITGDHSGHSLKTSSVSRSDYNIINNWFKNYNGFTRPKTMKTPSIKDRVLAMNALFCNALGERRVFVNKSECPKLHEDLIKVEWSESGFKLNTSNKELTHASDALSYFALNYYPTHKKNVTFTIY